MTNILDKNLRACDAAGVERPHLPPVDPAVVRIDDALDPPGVRLYSRSGRWILVHTARDPVAEAARQVDKALETNPTPATVVVVGAGLGHLVHRVFASLPDTRVLVFEPEPQLLRAWLERDDVSDWLAAGRVRCYAGPDYAGSAEAWRMLPPDGVSPPTIVHAVLNRERPEQVSRALALVASSVKASQGNAAARRQFARPYLLNTLANLRHVARAPSVAVLRDRATGVPAVILGAGPSLPRGFATLRALQDRVVLICVDTSLRPLLAAGIEPHFVVAADPGDVNARNFTALPPHPRTWLVAEPSVHPAVLSGYASQVATFRVAEHDPWPWLHACGVESARLDTFGSVVSSALDLAVVLGCDPIAYAGVDLAYTYGQPYVRGVTWEADWQKNLDDWEASGSPPLSLRQVWRFWTEARQACVRPDLHGRPTFTSPGMEVFRDQLVARMNKLDRRFINTTGAGILYGGSVRQASLDDVVRSAGHPTEILRGLLPQLDATAHRVAHEATVLWERLEGIESIENGAAPLKRWHDFVGGRLDAKKVRDALAQGLGLAPTCRPIEYRTPVSGLVCFAGDRPLDEVERSREFWDELAVRDARRYSCTGPSLEGRRLDGDQYDSFGEEQAREFVAFVGEADRTAKTVLDLGCGAGRCTRFFADEFGTVIAADFSGGMLAAARSSLGDRPHVRYLHLAGRDLAPIGDGTLDYVFSAFMMDTILNPEIQLRYLREIARVLRDGGLARVSVFIDPCSPPGSDTGARVDGDGWVRSPVRSSAVREVCGEVGLKILRRFDTDRGGQTWYDLSRQGTRAGCA